jgi:hypothetical protein
LNGDVTTTPPHASHSSLSEPSRNLANDGRLLPLPIGEQEQQQRLLGGCSRCRRVVITTIALGSVEHKKALDPTRICFSSSSPASAVRRISRQRWENTPVLGLNCLLLFMLATLCLLGTRPGFSSGIDSSEQRPLIGSNNTFSNTSSNDVILSSNNSKHGKIFKFLCSVKVFLLIA